MSGSSDRSEDFFVAPKDYSIGVAHTRAGKLMIPCAGGAVVIDTETGAVTHENMTPDEAAKVFWDAVSKYIKPRT